MRNGKWNGMAGEGQGKVRALYWLGGTTGETYASFMATLALAPGAWYSVLLQLMNNGPQHHGHM